MTDKKKLTKRQTRILREALRRYSRFHQGEKLTQAWTGLGSPSYYKPAVDAGLMEPIGQIVPRVANWYTLTEKGAEYVQEWLDAGLTHLDVEKEYRR